MASPWLRRGAFYLWCAASLLCAFAVVRPAPADEPPAAETSIPAPSAIPAEWYSLHFSTTVASQFHPSFRADYSGRNSLSPNAEEAHSVVMDLAAALRLWPGAQVCLQPELAGGLGLSSTLGMADFPSGEVYRVGDPEPTPVVGRAYLRQTIGLGGGQQAVEAGPCELVGQRERNFLSLSAGRLNGPDQFDNNPVSNDAHQRFTNWGLWASAAYDYAADTRGYTYGFTADLTMNWWSVRAGVLVEPLYANGMAMDFDVLRSHSVVLEGEGRYTMKGRPGAARLLLFLNRAPMGDYTQALQPQYDLSVSATRAYGRKKYGFAASANQDFGEGLSGFIRVSGNDGATESWAFTEVDRSLAIGVVQTGDPWHRPADAAGIAAVGSLLSPQHRAYLSAGGYGFLIGDAQLLHYGPEMVGEVFYEARMVDFLWLGADYQPVINPGYNRDRGPAHIFMLRGTASF